MRRLALGLFLTGAILLVVSKCLDSRAAVVTRCPAVEGKKSIGSYRSFVENGERRCVYMMVAPCNAPTKIVRANKP